MRFHFAKPKEQLIVCKTEQVGTYEVYLISTKLLGEMSKTEQYRVMYNGKRYLTYEEAIEQMRIDNNIEAHRIPRLPKAKDSYVWTYSGAELIELGVWPKFCVERNLKGSKHDMLGKWHLTRTEMTKLNIPIDEDKKR